MLPQSMPTATSVNTGTRVNAGASAENGLEIEVGIREKIEGNGGAEVSGRRFMVDDFMR